MKYPVIAIPITRLLLSLKTNLILFITMEVYQPMEEVLEDRFVLIIYTTIKMQQ